MRTVVSIEFADKYYSNKLKDNIICFSVYTAENGLLGVLNEKIYRTFEQKRLCGIAKKALNLRGHFVICEKSLKSNKIVLVNSITGESYELKNLNILL